MTQLFQDFDYIDSFFQDLESLKKILHKNRLKIEYEQEKIVEQYLHNFLIEKKLNTYFEISSYIDLLHNGELKTTPNIVFEIKKEIEEKTASYIPFAFSLSFNSDKDQYYTNKISFKSYQNEILNINKNLTNLQITYVKKDDYGYESVRMGFSLDNNSDECKFGHKKKCESSHKVKNFVDDTHGKEEMICFLERVFKLRSVNEEIKDIEKLKYEYTLEDLDISKPIVFMKELIPNTYITTNKKSSKP